MSQTTARYTISDLAGLAGSTPRTVRYYVAQGLLPPPVGAGPGAHYTDAHLERLRLIQRLQRQHLPLSEIRQRLAQLGEREVAELVAQVDPEAPTDSALDYVRTVLAGPMEPGPHASPAPAQPWRLLTSTPSLGEAPPPAASPPTAAAHAPRRLPKEEPIWFADAMPRALEVPARSAANAVSAAAAKASILAGEAAPAYVAPGSEPLASELQTPEQRSQWDRIGLTPNIEIHVRRPLSRLENRRVERLITIARHMLREEQP